ncbi:MAG: TonB-dependent receptor [Alphaproteobacteria bacterium]
MSKSKYFGASILALVVSMPAISAQAQLDEIIVSAQKREQGLQEVPISISAVSGELLEGRSIDSLEDMSSSVPNLTIADGQIDTTISIRGVQTGANKGFEQSVGMYFDGISYGRSQLIRTPLVDLERVEVLRGPQPTLFGKNAIAGAVNVVSAAPTEEFVGKFSAAYEIEHDEKQLLGVMSGSLSENLTARGVVSYRESDGYILNTTLNRKEPQRDEVYLRGKLRWDDGGPIQLNFKAEYASFDKHGYNMENNNALGTYTANPFFNGTFPGIDPVDVVEDGRRQSSEVNSLNEMYNAVFDANIDIGDHILTIVSGFVEYGTTELIDVDYTALNILDGTNQTEDYSQFSQEIRLASPGGEKIDYIAGLFFQTGSLEVTDHIELGSVLGLAGLTPLVGTFTDRQYEQDSNLYSAFAQADFNLSERLTITAGARYSHEDKKGSRALTVEANPGVASITNPNPVSGTADPRAPLANEAEFFWSTVLNIAPHQISDEFGEDTFDPLLRVQYDATENIGLYASYTGGSKAGGFDVRSNSVPGSPLVPGRRIGTFKFDGERAENYEVGAKMSWDRARFNVSAFRTDYTDLQTTIFDGVLSFLVENAAGARSQGVEVDGRFLVNDNIEFYGSGAYLDYKFTDFPQGQCNFNERSVQGITTEFCDRSGASVRNAPEFSGNFGVDFESDISDTLVLDANINVDLSSKYFVSTDNDPAQVQDSFAKLGGQIGISGGGGAWRLSVIGDNLTNERIKVTGGTLALAGTLTGGTGMAYDSLYMRPRNITFKVDYNF